MLLSINRHIEFSNYIQDLASHFHKFYNAEKVLTDDIEKTKAHVAMIEAVKITLKNALAMVGVSAPESMSRTFIYTPT